MLNLLSYCWNEKSADICDKLAFEDQSLCIDFGGPKLGHTHHYLHYTKSDLISIQYFPKLL